MTRSLVDVASLSSRLTAAMHNRTDVPGGNVIPPTLTNSVVTRGATGAERLQPDDLFDENPDLPWVVAKQVAQLWSARQFEQAESDRRRHRVQTRQNQQVAHAQQFQIAEFAVTGHDPRQHVRPGVLPTLLDHVDQICQQVLALLEVGRSQVGLVRDDGVLPTDEAVAILQRQTVEVHEDLKRVQACEISHHFALALAGERSDHLGGVLLEHRPGLSQSVRAEERLQYFPVAGVLRRVKSQRQHR